jgi:hypothetical protein
MSAAKAQSVAAEPRAPSRNVGGATGRVPTCVARRSALACPHGVGVSSSYAPSPPWRSNDLGLGAGAKRLHQIPPRPDAARAVMLDGMISGTFNLQGDRLRVKIYRDTAERVVLLGPPRGASDVSRLTSFL